MKTVELNIDEIRSPKELTQILQDKHLQKGDSLVLRTDYDKFIMILAFAAIAIIASGILRDKKKEEEGEELLSNLLAKYDTAEELERDIEKEYGIHIEIETKSPLDKAFGLWRNYNIDSETLRKEAWQRKG